MAGKVNSRLPLWRRVCRDSPFKSLEKKGEREEEEGGGGGGGKEIEHEEEGEGEVRQE